MSRLRAPCACGYQRIRNPACSRTGLYACADVYDVATPVKTRREKVGRDSSRFGRPEVMKLETVGVTEIRDVTLEEATRHIDRYLAKNPGTHYVGELVERLGLEPRIAFAAARKLIDKGRARLGRE